MRRVVVIGASGIIGQHLRLQQPEDVEVVYTTRNRFGLAEPLDLTCPQDLSKLATLADRRLPKVDVVVNLAGENRTDVVERDPKAHRWANVHLPQALAAWCENRGALLIHASSQGIFRGTKAPYNHSIDPLAMVDEPVNEYGRQKLEAEQWVARIFNQWMILRFTFVLGVRPFPFVGRINPLEAMFQANAESAGQMQVADRFFSPCFAEDAAKAVWAAVASPANRTVWHVGTPIRVSRHQLALLASDCAPTGSQIVPVQHDETYPDLAPRPLDTTYGDSARYWTELGAGMRRAFAQWQDRLQWYSNEDRGDELAIFLGQPNTITRPKLAEGFHAQHRRVAEDWRAANPKNHSEILDWYRETKAYCWELSAYHADRGFNYRGMCEGIAQHLQRVGAKRVLCLGDGIGDLTVVLQEYGLDPIYHDLAGSYTSMFAAFRFQRRGIHPLMLLTPDWAPPEEVFSIPKEPGEAREPALAPDAVIALDFFEHLPNVAEWAQAVAVLLKKGGWFLAQNAFGIGDEEHEGSIPMHLTINNHYVNTWPILLNRVGFEPDPAGSGWWRKAV